MPNLYGDWFHSRTGSQLSELAAIKLLVKSSYRTEYINRKWSAGRYSDQNRWLYDFSHTAKIGDSSIEPSTMQTKIRNWIRLGFIIDSPFLPLKWTQMGLLWEDAVDNGRGSDANLLYQLIIANSLGTISFSGLSRQNDKIPQKESLLIKFLMDNLENDTYSISREHLEQLIDGNTTRVGKNYSYWVTDLAQSGLFRRVENGALQLSHKYNNLLDGIYSYEPNDEITVQLIKEYPLAENAPFRYYLMQEFKKYGSDELIDAVETIAGQKILLSQVESAIRRRQKITFTRDHRWSKGVKDNYQFKCAIPGCDAEGRLFIEAAHIMPHREEDHEHNHKHRTDLQNGIALCLSCHKLFDGGLFTFDSRRRIQLSKFIYSPEMVQNPLQMNIIRIIESKNQTLIDPQYENFNLNYAQYHKENIFLGE